MNGEDQIFSPTNNRITIPIDYIENATSERLKLSLFIQEQQQAYILFLPVEESESFGTIGGISKVDGQLVVADAYRCTDYISVEGVIDIAYSIIVDSSAICAIYAYDANKQPLRVLLERKQNQNTSHLRPDGSYKYIRLSTLLRSSEGMCILYF